MRSLTAPGLFGNETRTATLLLIAMLGETHAAEIAKILGRSPSRIKEAVDSLERSAVIVGIQEGTAHRLRLNPRYLAADELRSLLETLAEADVALQTKAAAFRRRPRRAGKEI